MKDRLFREDGFKEFGIVREDVCPRCFTESAPGRRGVAKYFLAFVLVLLCQCFENLGAAPVQEPSLVASENNQIWIDGRESILGDLPNGAEITVASLGGSVLKGDPDGVIKVVEPSTPLGQGIGDETQKGSGHTPNGYIEIDHDSFLGANLAISLIVTPLLLFAIFSILFVINLGMPTGFSLAGSFNMEQSLSSIDRRLGTITEKNNKSRAICPNEILPYTREGKYADREKYYGTDLKEKGNNKQEYETMSKKTRKHRILERVVGMDGGMCGKCGAEFTILEGKVQRCPVCGHKAKLKGEMNGISREKERIRVLEGKLLIARVAIMQQAKTIKKLKKKR